MSKLLTAILSWAMSSFANKVLTSIGFVILGTISFGAFVNYFLNKAIASFSDIPMLGLIGIAGIDKAISIMISAYVMRVYLATVVSSIKFVKK